MRFSGSVSEQSVAAATSLVGIDSILVFSVKYILTIECDVVRILPALIAKEQWPQEKNSRILVSMRKMTSFLKNSRLNVAYHLSFLRGDGVKK